MVFLRRKKAICFFAILFITLIPIFFSQFYIKNKGNKLGANDIIGILLRNNIVNKEITYVKVLYCHRKTSRSECGWNIILEIKPTDIDPSKLTLLDSEAKEIFIDWLGTEEEFSKNLSFPLQKSIKIYRPAKSEGIGFPAILCNARRCIVLLYNSKP